MRIIVRSIAGTHDWECVAEWHGSLRRIFRGTVRECLIFAYAEEKLSETHHVRYRYRTGHDSHEFGPSTP